MSALSCAISDTFDPITDTGNQSFDIGSIKLQQEIKVRIGNQETLDDFHQFFFCDVAHGAFEYTKTEAESIHDN